ncbi:MAG: hypothetical protein AAB674_01560 [Patescibacteria group bacterium]
MPRKKKIKEWDEESEKDTPNLDEASEIESPNDLLDSDDLDAVSDADDAPSSKMDDDASDFE